MCGIAGVVRLDGGKVELQTLKDMNAAMHHRDTNLDKFLVIN